LAVSVEKGLPGEAGRVFFGRSDGPPEHGLLRLPVKRVNRRDVREARGLEVNRLAGM
jgi:hypothetical protein